jgi:hypothetical protein
MPENTVPTENVSEREAFIRRAIDSFHNTRTESPAVMRNVSVTAYVSSELSQNNRRGLSQDERGAVEGAAADKLRQRFGGS